MHIGLSSLRGILHDVRYGWRGLRRKPVFTVVAVLTLALGVGGGATFAALTNALVFAPIRVANLDRVFAIVAMERSTSRIEPALPVRILQEFERGTRGTAAAIGIDAGTWTATLQTATVTATSVVGVGAISGGYARVLDLPVQAGRWVGPDDDIAEAAPVVVISDRLWRSWYGARRDAIGRTTIAINGKPFTVIGVAPAGFIGLRPGLVRPDAWIAIRSSTRVFPEPPATGLGLVKARAGATIAQLRGDVLGDGHDTFYDEWLSPVATALRDDRAVSTGWLLLALSALAWIASCANLANLLFARSSERAAETAVRLSLGASRVRILRLFFAETMIISALSTIAGVLLALAGTWIFGALVPDTGGAGLRSALDLISTARLTLYAGSGAAIAAVVVGIATARHASRVSSLQTIAASDGHAATTSRGGAPRTALVALQITVAVMLVMGAGLFLERYRQTAPWAARHVDLTRRTASDTAAPEADRFDASHLATAALNLGLAGYDGPRGLAFLGRLLTDLRSLPDVDAVALTSGLPTSEPGTNYLSVSTEEDRDPNGRDYRQFRRLVPVQPIRASSGFFDSIGITARRTAGFSTWDAPDGPPVAVISESAAKALWPGRDPLGRHVMLPHFKREARRIDYDAVEIVGISADPVMLGNLSPRWAANVLVMPVASWWEEAGRPPLQVVLRAERPAAQLEPLRRAIRALDPAVAMLDVSTRDDYVGARFGVARALDALMAALGGLAFVIAMLGVYGVIAYFVSTRTREFGVRLALGATPARIARLVIDYAIHVVLIGLLPGVFVVSVGSRLLQAHVLDLMPNDITTWVAVPVVILAAGIVAGYLPARRAALVDPNVALREL